MDLNAAHLLWQQSGSGTDTAEIWAAISRMKKKDKESCDREFNLDPRMIECPALLLDGTTENIYSRGVEILQEVALEAISHPEKKRVTGPKELGADGHCQVANTNFINRVTYDWLDEVFEKEAVKAATHH